NDYAGLLAAGERGRLEAKLAEYQRATGTQMAIAIFRSLEGESLEDVANRLFQQWRLGQKRLDNGVLLVVFVQDRKLRFEIGYGLEAVVPDAVAGQIIRQVIAPNFRDRRYAAGLGAAADAVYARLAAGGAAGAAGAAAASRAVEAGRVAVAQAGAGRAMAKRPRWTRRFLGEPDFDAVSAAIKAAETRTSAEIRVHLERRLPRRFFGEPADALARARTLF